ncbi:MAG: hypothetical protein AAFR47_17480 [Pseudomonadota bacterium]
MTARTFRMLLFGFLLGGSVFAALDWMRPGYTRNFWVGLDVFANTVIGGEVETISERWGRAEARGNWWAARACDVLDVFFNEVDHCVVAWARGGHAP